MSEINGNLIFIAKKIFLGFPKETQDKIISKMKPHNAEIFSGIIMSNQKYSLEMFVDFLEAIKIAKGPEFLREQVYKSAEKQLKGVFKVAAMLASKMNLLPKAISYIWVREFAIGSVETITIKSKTIEMVLVDFDVPDIILWSAVRWFEEFFRIVLDMETRGHFKKEGLRSIFLFNVIVANPSKTLPKNL